VKKRLILSGVVLALILTLSAGALLGGTDTAEAPPSVGLSVEPGGMLIQGVEPGQVYDLEEKTGILLTIHNRDRSDHTYMLATFRPSEVGNRRLPTGYSDIPDPAWFSFQHSEVRVPANSSGQVRMHLEIPDDDRYRNQHWSVSVGVAGKPEPGETLTLAVYPRFEIETASAPRAELSLRPAGGIGLCSSVVTLNDAGPGRAAVGEFVICNNDGKTHSYHLSVLAQGDTGEGKRLFPSGGSGWMPGSDWVSLPRPRLRHDTRWSVKAWPTLWLARQSHVPVPIEVNVPAGMAVPDGGWEAIVFVERDDGAVGFVRVRVPNAGSGDEGAA